MLLSKRPKNPWIPSSKDLSFFCLILISPNSFYTSEPPPLSSHSFFPLAFSYEALFKFLFLSSFSCCCCSIAQSCPTLYNPMDCSKPGFPVFYYLLEFAQTHVHWVDDAIQPSHPLSPPSPPALNLSQQPGLFKWVSSSHQVAKVLELQLQHQSFQCIFNADFL